MDVVKNCPRFCSRDLLLSLVNILIITGGFLLINLLVNRWTADFENKSAKKSIIDNFIYVYIITLVKRSFHI